MKTFKYLIIMTFLTSLISCFRKESKSIEKEIIGSTIENINNSKYTGFKFQIENELCLATINEYFKGYKYKSNFPYALWVNVETRDKNVNGHPIDTEASIFNQLEDYLISKFDKKTPYCFIGRTTRNGFREIVFYVSDKNKAAEIMDEFKNENKFNREIDFSIDRDETWKSVEGFLE